MYYKLVKKLATISVASMGLLTLAACSSSSEQASSDVVKVGVLQYMEHESLTAAR